MLIENLDGVKRIWVCVFSFIAEFEELGVEIPVDFAEVTEDDLTAMGLPHLQKRRFAQVGTNTRSRCFKDCTHQMACLVVRRN